MGVARKRAPKKLPRIRVATATVALRALYRAASTRLTLDYHDTEMVFARAVLARAAVKSRKRASLRPARRR